MRALFAFRLRVLARLRNRFVAELMTVLYRKFYIFSVVVDVSDDDARVGRIVKTLRGFWSAMARDDLETARRALREDTAYWLAELPGKA